MSSICSNYIYIYIYIYESLSFCGNKRTIGFQRSYFSLLVSWFLQLFLGLCFKFIIQYEVVEVECHICSGRLMSLTTPSLRVVLLDICIRYMFLRCRSYRRRRPLQRSHLAVLRRRQVQLQLPQPLRLHLEHRPLLHRPLNCL